MAILFAASCSKEQDNAYIKTVAVTGHVQVRLYPESGDAQSWETLEGETEVREITPGNYIYRADAPGVQIVDTVAIPAGDTLTIQL